MKQKVETYKIVCDCCGQVYQTGDDSICFVDDPSGDCIEGCSLDSDWRKMADGKHYCESCWNWDDEDNIVTNDGHKYDGETYEEIV